MRLSMIGLILLLGGALAMMAACGAPESTASAAPADAPAGRAPGASTVVVGDAAIAALAAAEPPQNETLEEVAPQEDAPQEAASAPPVRVAAADVAVTEAGGGPRIVVPDPIFNFGTMETGEKREHTWTIHNEGDADLLISSVRPACGCTNTNLAEDVVPPGGSTTLSSVLELPSQTGPVRKNIAVSSNDPRQATLVLAFEGTATQAIALDPSILTFRDLTVDTVETQTADVIATEDDVTFTITELGSGRDIFDYSYETIEEGRHYRVSVTTRPPLEGSYINDRVYIRTDHPRFDLLQLNAIAIVLTDLITAPDILRLNGAHQEPIKRMILVRAGRVGDFKVTGVELPDPQMTYEVAERQPGMFYIEVDQMVARPELDGSEVIIFTDVPSTPEIRVPITVVGGAAPVSLPNLKLPQAEPAG